MKFGLHFQLPCYGSQSPVQRYRDTLEQSVHAEALGFESVWPVEQHFNADLSITPAPLLLLAALAERTRTLRLGIAIVLLPLSHPIRVAEEQPYPPIRAAANSSETFEQMGLAGYPTARPMNRRANRWRFSTRQRSVSSGFGACARNSASGA